MVKGGMLAVQQSAATTLRSQHAHDSYACHGHAVCARSEHWYRHAARVLLRSIFGGAAAC